MGKRGVAAEEFQAATTDARAPEPQKICFDTVEGSGGSMILCLWEVGVSTAFTAEEPKASILAAVCIFLATHWRGT